MFPGQVLTGETFTPHYSWLVNTDNYEQIGVMVDKDSVDAGSTPTTTLRSGLVVAQVTADGKYMEYVAGGAGGKETAKGILLHPIRLKDAYGAASVEPISGTVVIRARIKSALCYVDVGALSADAAALAELRTQGFLIEEDFDS